MLPIYQLLRPHVVAVDHKGRRQERWFTTMEKEITKLRSTLMIDADNFTVENCLARMKGIRSRSGARSSLCRLYPPCPTEKHAFGLVPQTGAHHGPSNRVSCRTGPFHAQTLKCFLSHH